RVLLGGLGAVRGRRGLLGGLGGLLRGLFRGLRPGIRLRCRGVVLGAVRLRLRLRVLLPAGRGRGEPGDECRVEPGAFQGLAARTYALLHTAGVWSTNLCGSQPAPTSLSDAYTGTTAHTARLSAAATAKPATERTLSRTVQVLSVSRSLMPKYLATIQNPPSLTC